MKKWNDGMMGLVARSALCLCALLLLPALAWADSRVEITPRISASEVYDDNINLDNTNEESDYLTTVSPGINLTMSSQRTSLSLEAFLESQVKPRLVDLETLPMVVRT